MLGDPFLNYFALGLLIFVVVVIFYGIIAIHDIPAKIAEARHHPHSDAIHAILTQTLSTRQAGSACSLSMCCGRFSGSGRWRTSRNAVGDFPTRLPDHLTQQQK
jgi:hypothetical protein